MIGCVMAAKSDELIGQATLDIFSGRPNPTWTLTATETSELRQQVAALSARLATVPRVPDLGYRGVRVVMPSVQITAGHGGISVEEGSATTSYADPGRRLESWLLHTAQGKVAPDVLRIATDSLR